MNLPDATKLAQEAAAMTRRSELIGKEAVRFAEMARKVGGATRPALRLMGESERLQAEADRLRAEAQQLLAQSHALLPAAEIVEGIAPVPQTAADPNVVDVEPVPPPARIVREFPQPKAEVPRPPAPVAETPRRVVETARPAAPSAPAAPPKTESPLSVPLREVNRVHDRFPSQLPSQLKPSGPAAKTEKPTGFFKRVLGLGPKTAPARPAPIITRSAAATQKPATEMPKPAAEVARPAEPMFEAPKVEAPKVSAPAPAPKIVAPVPEPPRVEKPAPPPQPVAPAAPTVPPKPPGFVTCHCPHCDQGVEFEAAQLPEDNYVIPCPGCGKDMKLTLP